MNYKIIKKKKNPKFMRQEFNKRIRLSRSSWRKPKGVDSKMREQRGGHRPIVKIGYGTPRILRGRLSNGLIEKRIYNKDDLSSLNKDEIALIPRTIGNKLRLVLLKEAQKLKIKVSNFKNIENKIKEIEDEYKLRKEKRAKLKLKKNSKLKESKPKAEKKEDKKESKPKAEKKESKPKAEKKEDKKESKPKAEKKEDKKESKPKAEKKEDKKESKPKAEKKESKPKKEGTKK